MHLPKYVLPAMALVTTLVALPTSAAVITHAASALHSSPGAYAASGYYTDDLGKVAVMTGGAAAPNIGGPNGRNDDGFMALNLGFDLTFFGRTYNHLYLNNNGNVSFGAGISAYVPEGPTGALAPVISVFFGDVDTRHANSGVMHYQLGSDQLVVTWHQVGSYNQQGAALNSFQLVLRGDGYMTPAGEGKIGFFYGDMNWEQTSTSQTAAVGFGDGAGNSVVIAGSNAPGMAGIVENHYIWFDEGLAPVDPNQVPEPGSLALLCVSALGLVRYTRRHR